MTWKFICTPCNSANLKPESRSQSLCHYKLWLFRNARPFCTVSFLDLTLRPILNNDNDQLTQVFVSAV